MTASTVSPAWPISSIFSIRRCGSPDPDGKPVREALPLGPKTEDEIDRILRPALAEIGLPPESLETPVQAAPPSPRLPDPVPLHPKPLPLPSSGGARISPPASAVPEEFLDAPESVPETLSQSVRRPIPTPGEGEPPFASPGPAAGGRSKRIQLIAGLILVTLIGAAYLGFGRRTPIQTPLAAAPAPPVEQAVVRSDRRDAAVAKASLPEPAAVQKPAAETKPAETLFEGVMASPPAGSALQLEGKTGTERELLPPIKTPAETPAKPEPEANPPAGAKDALQAAAAAKDETPPKAKTEEAPAAAKIAAEPAARPEPVKSGDLVELSAVDIPPALLNSVEPVYPPLAYRNKQQAKVALTVLISEKGRNPRGQTGGGSRRRSRFCQGGAARRPALELFARLQRRGGRAGVEDADHRLQDPLTGKGCEMTESFAPLRKEQHETYRKALDEMRREIADIDRQTEEEIQRVKARLSALQETKKTLVAASAGIVRILGEAAADEDGDETSPEAAAVRRGTG